MADTSPRLSLLATSAKGAKVRQNSTEGYKGGYFSQKITKGTKTEFLTEDNEGNEGLRFADSDVVDQAFVGSLVRPVENRLSEQSVARRAKLKGYTKAKSKQKNEN
jgi:hypothetical protein